MLCEANKTSEVREDDEGEFAPGLPLLSRSDMSTYRGRRQRAPR